MSGPATPASTSHGSAGPSAQLTPLIISAHYRVMIEPMPRFAHSLGLSLLLAAAAIAAGCSGGASLITGSTASATEVPGAVPPESPLARPTAVAWTSARAEKCGFYFDSTKLRANYLAYEAKQSTPDQLTKAQQAYDSTFKMIGQRVAANPDYCSDRKSAEIKAELTRHLAGDFTAKPVAVAKKEENCGWLGWGCTPAARPDEKWDTEKWWKDEANKRMGR